MAYVAVFIPGRGAQRHELGEANLFGRSPESRVCLEDPNVSRHHCKLERVDGKWWLNDLGSTNGTWLDAARVKRYAIRDGETFYIGDVRIVFHTDQWVRHRPTDPHEARRMDALVGSTRNLDDTKVQRVRRHQPLRPLPNPAATVVVPRPVGASSRPATLVPLAFLRPPATPIVKDVRSGGWIRVVLKRLVGG